MGTGEWAEAATAVEADIEEEEVVEEEEENVTEADPLAPGITEDIPINAWAATRPSMVEVGTERRAHMGQNSVLRARE